MKPYGTCDICKTNTATIWWGKTSAAICQSSKCGDAMWIKWKAYEEEFEAEQKYRKMMGEYE